jgi:hypothetical protein
MQKYVCIATVLFATVLAVSCDFSVVTCEDDPREDRVKPPIVLQLKATNNMDTSINVQIRHRYKKGWAHEVGDISYSDWIGYDIPAGGDVILGDETATHMEDGVETTWSGFVLLDDELNRYFGSTDGYSSFDLKVTAEDKVLQLAGYEVEAPCYAETRLCDLWQEVYDFGPVWRKALLFNKQSGITSGLVEPTLLIAALTIHADGTYRFDLKPPEDMLAVLF